jgi:hypothetical protein
MLAGPGLRWALAGLVVLASLSLAFVLARRFLARRRGEASFPLVYRRLLALAARRGLRPSAWETAGEFADRAGEVLGDAEVVRSISALYERERFGGRPPTTAERDGALAALARLARGPVRNSG